MMRVASVGPVLAEPPARAERRRQRRARHWWRVQVNLKVGRHATRSTDPRVRGSRRTCRCRSGNLRRVRTRSRSGRVGFHPRWWRSSSSERNSLRRHRDLGAPAPTVRSSRSGRTISACWHCGGCARWVVIRASRGGANRSSPRCCSRLRSSPALRQVSPRSHSRRRRPRLPLEASRLDCAKDNPHRQAAHLRTLLNGSRPRWTRSVVATRTDLPAPSGTTQCSQ